MKGTVTLRNIPPEVLKVIEETARRKKLSANRAVVSLLEEALHVGRRGPEIRAYDDLDSLFGRWSGKEAASFVRHIEAQRGIDKELWR